MPYVILFSTHKRVFCKRYFTRVDVDPGSQDFPVLRDALRLDRTGGIYYTILKPDKVLGILDRFQYDAGGYGFFLPTGKNAWCLFKPATKCRPTNVQSACEPYVSVEYCVKQKKVKVDECFRKLSRNSRKCSSTILNILEIHGYEMINLWCDKKSMNWVMRRYCTVV